MQIYTQIDAYLQEFSWNVRGGFYLEEGDALYAKGFRTLLMVGNLGGAYWKHFMREKKDHVEHPLDDWTKTKLSILGEKFSCTLVYPFEGPPYYPFVTWAKRAEVLEQSPIGILIHPEYGLWHSYRAALLWDSVLDIPPKPSHTHPCNTCTEKPCLTTCPISAVSEKNGLDFKACKNYLRTEAAFACYQQCCQARRSCIIGPQHGYGEEHSMYHTRRFSGST